MQELRRIDNYFRLYGSAVRFYRPPSLSKKGSNEKPPARRSKIRSFSSHSRLRLRDALARYEMPGCKKYGVCLTVPWVDTDFDVMAEYRACFNRFGVSFRRSFPGSAAIFRHELQVRKMPHCHFVLYLSLVDALDEILLQDKIWQLWKKAVMVSGLHGGSECGFMRYGIKFEPLDDLPDMMRYLSDHTSKSKQAQLGYQGKQWGYINRSVLVLSAVPVYRFPDEKIKVQFVRHIQKMCRFRISIPISSKRDYFKCFSFKRSSRRRLSSIYFADLSTTARLADFLGCYQTSESGDVL